MLWGMAGIPEVWAEWTGASWGMERVSLSSLGRVSEEPEAEPVWLRLRAAAAAAPPRQSRTSAGWAWAVRWPQVPKD